jgi:hypothetical protein
MTNQVQNHNSFAVVVSPSGGLPSLQNQNSNEYWDMQNIGYEILHTGNKRDCQAFLEEMMGELNNINYFE